MTAAHIRLSQSHFLTDFLNFKAWFILKVLDLCFCKYVFDKIIKKDLSIAKMPKIVVGGYRQHLHIWVDSKLENIAKLLNFWPRKKCLIDLEIPRETWVNDYIEIFLCHFLSIMIPIKFKLINYLNQAQKCVVHFFKKKSTLKIKTNFCYFCNFCCPTETRWFGLMKPYSFFYRFFVKFNFLSNVEKFKIQSTLTLVRTIWFL